MLLRWSDLKERLQQYLNSAIRIYKSHIFARSANVVGARKSNLVRGGVRGGVRGVRIIIDFYHMAFRGVDMRSVYCVFEHLIFMDLERSPK